MWAKYGLRLRNFPQKRTFGFLSKKPLTLSHLLHNFSSQSLGLYRSEQQPPVPFRREGDEVAAFLSFGVLSSELQAKSMSRAWIAHVAQLVEHVLGKDEVISSILIMGSKRFDLE